MSKKEIISVITIENGIVDEMVVFTDGTKAEKHFTDKITDFANCWSESQEKLCTSDDIYSISETELNIALEEGWWEKNGTMYTIVHSSNSINLCSFSTK